MKKHTITAIAITALALFAGSALAAEDLDQSGANESGGTQSVAGNGVEIQYHPTQQEAELAGFLREQRILRWLREQRQLRSFYCGSGPAIQAALSSPLFGLDFDCAEETN